MPTQLALIVETRLFGRFGDWHPVGEQGLRSGDPNLDLVGVGRYAKLTAKEAT